MPSYTVINQQDTVLIKARRLARKCVRENIDAAWSEPHYYISSWGWDQTIEQNKCVIGRDSALKQARLMRAHNLLTFQLTQQSSMPWLDKAIIEALIHGRDPQENTVSNAIYFAGLIDALKNENITLKSLEGAIQFDNEKETNAHKPTNSRQASI